MKMCIRDRHLSFSPGNGVLMRDNTPKSTRTQGGDPIADYIRAEMCIRDSFRSLAPIVLEQALKESGTQLREPYLSFILYAPQEYLSRAYHDAPKYCARRQFATELLQAKWVIKRLSL